MRASGSGAEAWRDPPSSPPPLDEVAKSIIASLRQDARGSYATIARAVGLSEAAVRQRVQRLLDQGVVQIVSVTEPGAVGLCRQALLGIRCEGSTDDLAAELGALAEVRSVVSIAGPYDVLAEVACLDDPHLLELVNSRIKGIPAVRSAEVFVYLSQHLHSHMWNADRFL